MSALCVISGAAIILERTKLGRIISGPGLVLLLAMTASQIGVIPRSAPLYDVIWVYLLPIAIALFLFKADLVTVWRKGGRTLGVFLIGAVGTAAGAVVGGMLLEGLDDRSRLPAVFAATFTGGSLNFMAVADTVGLPRGPLLSTALAVDNVLGFSYILVANFIAGWALLARAFPWRLDSMRESAGDAPQDSDRPGATTLGILVALAVAAGASALSAFIADLMNAQNYKLLVLTLLMTVAATIGRQAFSKIRGENVIAFCIIYLFFGLIGASVDFSYIADAGTALILLALSIFVFHILFLAVLGRIFKLNIAELAVGSLACIAGPPVAAATAIAFGWRGLVVPGLLTGILGYVLGNLIGAGVFLVLGGEM